MFSTIYWLDGPKPGVAILALPRGDDGLESDIQGWRDAGVDVVVSLLTDSEIFELGLLMESQYCEEAGLKYINFRIEDHGVPTSGEAVLKLVKELAALLASGNSIGFHCHGCIGRSPLIASCLLMFMGKTAAEAFEMVSTARGFDVPETTQQVNWGKSFARGLRNSN